MNSTENDNLVAQLIDANDQRDALMRENAELKELLVKMSEEQPARDDALVETVQKQAQMIKDLTAQVETLRKDKQELIQQRTEQEVRERELRAKNAAMHDHTQKWSEDVEKITDEALAEKDAVMRGDALAEKDASMRAGGIASVSERAMLEHIAKVANAFASLSHQEGFIGSDGVPPYKVDSPEMLAWLRAKAQREIAKTADIPLKKYDSIGHKGVIDHMAQKAKDGPNQVPVSDHEPTNGSHTSDHAADTIAKISNLLSVLNQQARNDRVESAEKIDKLTKDRDQFRQERDVAIATMKQQVSIIDNRFGEMRQESLDALKNVRTKAESIERLLTQRTNELANTIMQRDESIQLAEKRLNELHLMKAQLVSETTVRVDAVKIQEQLSQNLSDAEKKLDELNAEVRRLHEMLTLRTDEKAKLQKQLDDLQPILSALSKHWGRD